MTFIECVVGFSVIQHPKSSAYLSTVSSPKIAIFRLSNDIMRVAEGPVNLLETTNIFIFYKKVISSKCCSIIYIDKITFYYIIIAHHWGVLIYEHLYALNAIHGGTIMETLQNYNCRRVYASMIRETFNVSL